MAQKIRTTHVGSLPRPPQLAEVLVAREKGDPVEAAAFDTMVAREVDSIVARQREIGLDVVNDGEMSKINYATYVTYRFNGMSRLPGAREDRDWPKSFQRYPGWAKSIAANSNKYSFCHYECDGPLSVRDNEPLEKDLRRLRDAAEMAGANELFMTAASPGILAGYFPNKYYPSHEDYLSALVDVVRPEYEAIVAAGYTLQLDCPDLSATMSGDETEADARRGLAVDAINAATANIDPQRMRMHLCWGNYEGPHDDDAPLSVIFPIAAKARPATILFEGANPRHEHEWAFFKNYTLPEGKTIVPGVIDNTTNFIEHPELVAQRIERYVDVVGADRVMAGVDCGFGTHALADLVDADIAFAKLRSLVEGAAIASSRIAPGSGNRVPVASPS